MPHRPDQQPSFLGLDPLVQDGLVVTRTFGGEVPPVLAPQLVRRVEEGDGRAALGGGAGPLLPPALWVLVKTCALLAVFLLLGRAMPAVRPQRLAEIGWVVVLPLVLLQLLVTSVLAVTGN